MNTQCFRTLARPPGRGCPNRRSKRWLKLHLFQFFIFLFLVAVLVVEPSSLQMPGAALTSGNAEGVVAQVSCSGGYHIVRPGQTIYSIAAAYGTTAYRIAVCNRSGYTVYVGQSLLIPTRTYRGGSSG